MLDFLYPPIKMVVTDETTREEVLNSVVAFLQLVPFARPYRMSYDSDFLVFKKHRRFHVGPPFPVAPLMPPCARARRTPAACRTQLTRSSTARVPSERQPPACSCRSPRRRLDVPWHHFGSKQLDGAHGLLVAEITPLERADEVVGTGGHVLVHVLAYRSRSAGQRHTAEPVGMLASRLLVKTLQLGVDVPPHFTCR